jgi:CRP-like cAMP-binding protein
MYEVLKQVLLRYEPLTDEEWEVISDRFAYRQVYKSDFYLRQGQICRKIGLVVKGFLRTYHLDESGNELTTHFAHDHSFVLSFYSFRNQAPSFESILATEDSHVLEMDYLDLQHLFEVLPKWNTLYRKIIEEAYACMEQRNYVLQSLSASKRYQLLIEQAHPQLLYKAQLGHIASYLGITQETLSRIRKKSSTSII